MNVESILRILLLVLAAAFWVYGILIDKKPEKTEITKNEKAARTGDRSSFGLWLALLFVSGGTIASIAIVYRKKKA